MRAFWGAITDGSLFEATAFTLGTAALGLLIGALGGLLLGTLLGLSRRAAQLGFLSVEVARPIPSVALIPLAMLVFGFGLRMELSVVAFACLWPMLVLTQAAVQQVEPRLLEVARALELTPRHRFTWIVGPAIVPRLFVALRLGVAIALVVAVTVEIAANPHGMGYAMMIAQQSPGPGPDAGLAGLDRRGRLRHQRRRAGAAAPRGARHGGASRMSAAHKTHRALTALGGASGSVLVLGGFIALWWAASTSGLGQPRLPAHAAGHAAEPGAGPGRR